MRLLKKKHIDDISVSELCAEAQINRTTFYRHYHTPHDVLMEAELDFITEFYAVPVLLKDAADIRRHAVRMCNFLYDNKDLVKLFISNNMDLDFTDLFQNFADEFLGSRIVRYKGQPADEDTIRLMSTLFTSGGYALIRQWLVEEIPKTPEEIADLLFGSFNLDFTIK